MARRTPTCCGAGWHRPSPAREPGPGQSRRRAVSNPTQRLHTLRSSAHLLLLACAAITACNGATPGPPTSRPPSGSAGSSAAPGASPSSPTVGNIDHPTGATDVVLRIEQGGGFVPIDFLANQSPDFTLFGNGVIVFKPRLATVPQPGPDGVVKLPPWRTRTLDEDQIQDLISFALGRSGLGVARATYSATDIADAPDTIFTIRAGGVAKTVTINALNEETRPGPDSVARQAFVKLAERLQDYDQGGSIPSDPYLPARYRGLLTPRDADPLVRPIAWPWPGLKAADFRPGPTDGSGGAMLPHRTMSPNEVAALNLTGMEGGLQSMAIRAPDGTLYSLALRPLLVDEGD